ncbi:hypothetical protein A2U01_0014019 [Trifolium medium]|uniref:Uncharacterized protein n=1 Tax=Trifolium medium TaxID=97028 RepID=A0A392N0G3_9FABA|nr:hypothetical protein [Trifolium medium]
MSFVEFGFYEFMWFRSVFQDDLLFLFLDSLVVRYACFEVLGIKVEGFASISSYYASQVVTAYCRSLQGVDGT